MLGAGDDPARATQNLSSFNLDLDGLTVRSIRVDGRSANWARDGDELTITPRIGIRERPSVLVDDPLRRRAGDDRATGFGMAGFIHTDDGALVVGQPHVAATWYPVNDHPSDKASYTFRVTVPKGSRRSPTASSSGAGRSAAGRPGSGTRTSRWPRT